MYKNLKKFLYIRCKYMDLHFDKDFISFHLRLVSTLLYIEKDTSFSFNVPFYMCIFDSKGNIIMEDVPFILENAIDISFTKSLHNKLINYNLIGVTILISFNKTYLRRTYRFKAFKKYWLK